MPNLTLTTGGPRSAFMAYMLLAAVACATICSRTQAQNSAPDIATKESGVRMAYVAVLDKKGTPVTDLKAEDFSLTEDKIPQQIANVSSSADSRLVLGAMIDVSGSAREDESLHDKLNVLLRFLAISVGGSEEAYIVAFASSSRRLTGITSNISELLFGLQEVDKANPYGPTALFDSLVSTVEWLPPGLAGRKVLLVLSDFEDNTSHQNLDKAIFDMQVTGAAVFAFVNFAKGHESDRSAKLGAKVSRRMAEETGGECYLIKSPQDMEAALHRMQLVLRNSYALSYHATARPRNDGSVPLKIETHRKDLQLVFIQLRPPLPL